MSGRIPRFFVGFVAYAVAIGTLAGAAIIATPSVASANVIPVTNGNDSGAGSLREALLAAAASPLGDDINIADSVSTITLTTGVLPASADADITVNGGDGVVIQQNTPNAGVFVDVGGGCAFLNLNTVTVQGANGSGGPAISACRVTLIDSVVQDNSTSSAAAGGVKAVLTVSMANSIIRNNVSTAAASPKAGGVLADEVTILLGSTIENNSATGGGNHGAGGVAALRAVDIEDSTVVDNDIVGSTTAAGGVLSLGTDGTDVTVIRSTVSGNTATSTGSGFTAGGVHNDGPSSNVLYIESSTVTGNTATNSGSGRSIGGASAAEVTLSFATLVKNTADASDPANIRTGDSIGLTGPLATRGSVIAQPLGGGPNCLVVTTSSDNNYSDDASGAVSCKLAHATDLVGAGNNPQLGALAANGGPTMTMRPLAGSPVINEISDVTCGDAPPDQRGVSRPQGGTCDIGAVEFAVPSAPTGVSGVPGDAQVLVSWVAPASVGDGPITEYTVTAAPGGAGCTWITGPLTCTVPGLDNGTPYTFTVVARNAGLDGPASVASGPVTPVPPAEPGAPTGPVASAGNEEATVSWTAPASDGGSPITSYEARSTPDGLTCTRTLPGPLNCTVMGLTNGQPYTFRVTATNAVGTGPPSVDSNSVIPMLPTSGSLTSLTPARILDTRTGTGLAGAFGPQQTRDLPVLNVGGVPSAGVDAVLVNVTATGSSAGGWLTLFPAGGALPVATSVNFGPGQTIATLVVVKVGAGGAVSINNTGGNPSASAVHVIGDVVGWYSDATAPDAGRFTGVTPARVLDTRDGTGLSGAFTPQQSRKLVLGGTGGVPMDADAVVINMTSVSPTAGGWLTLFPNGETLPVASSLNFAPGQTIANLVTVKLGGDEKSVLINNTGGNPSAGFVHVVGDVVGYYKNGTDSRLTTIMPERILDTRPNSAAAPQGNVTVDPQLSAAVPDVGEYTAVVVHVTATGPGAVGWLTAFPSDESVPLAASLNFGPGQTVANLAKIKVGPDGKFKINNSGGNPSAGFVHVIVDIVGYYE